MFGVTPPDGATDVEAGTNVTAAFSTPMDASSLVPDSFTLTDLISGKTVKSQVSYDAASKTATLDPQSPLSPGHVYEATLVNTASGKKAAVRDAEGNPLSSERSWRFTVDIVDP